MPPLAAVRESNALWSPPTPPVAIFVGGTSGIGQGTAQAFARHTKGNAHIILAGRNRAAADAIFTTFPEPTSPASKYEFVHCDATLMRNVAATTSGLCSRLKKVNYLVLTCGALRNPWEVLRGVREPTAEGIPDTLLAITYYARAKFALDLLPLLRAAKDAGEDAHVLIVLAAGHGGPVDLDDIGLRKPYTLSTARPTVVTYTDVLVESLSALAPEVTFTHICPGLVSTPLFRPWARPLMNLLLTSIDDCGEYMLYALLDSGSAGGTKRKGARGDDIGMEGYYGGEEVRERVWAHTMETVESALAVKLVGNGTVEV
ncbi:NAD(P)-binding protein [Daedalea quercina L-15889]|uniref:NAD(P)-binding protein n=1 Tax=Daedalea quercina L-15889 TaxID=1314783 RepID=A0A165RKE8_9APHY|nr:NAD(P)-binding protein [Daedalea quercina L-15889]